MPKVYICADAFQDLEKEELQATHSHLDRLAFSGKKI